MVIGLAASTPTYSPAQERVEFVLVTDSMVVVPAPGESTVVRIALHITPRDETLRFNTLDTINISLVDGAGSVLPMDGGRDGTRPGSPISEPIPVGETLIVDRAAVLVWSTESNLRLQGDDGFGGLWYVDGLQPGVYRLRVHYKNAQTRGSDETRVWTGEGTPLETELEVQP
ncbi:MAG: hypothetical protein O6922_06020 [Chloroflexi bacterium]|nr:hypothetical protein [Chloroflexota bacterium]